MLSNGNYKAVWLNAYISNERLQVRVEVFISLSILDMLLFLLMTQYKKY